LHYFTKNSIIKQAFGGEVMNIDLTRLLHSYIEEIKIDDLVHFDDEYLKTTEIRKLSDVEVKGSIVETSDDLYALELVVKGEMILPCAITLEDVPS
jgi:uncharacterized metal-binding protein YceD (DUF177 family)